MPLQRLTADLLLFIAILLFPWQVSFAFGLLLFFRFVDFYELIAAGFIFDILYGIPLREFFGFQFVAALAMIAVFPAAAWFKTRVRYYGR